MTGRLAIAPIEPSRALTVVIPARNEEGSIRGALDAFAQQAGASDFEIVVFANNCTDATAERARSAARSHPRLRIHVVEGSLPAASAHVGAARKILMDAAARRLIAAGRPTGIVATTDADTIVAPDWVANTQEEMLRADAVAGFVEVAPDDRRDMPAPVRLLYERETAFRRALTEIEDLIDPRPEDPAPRHGAFVGASFAVTARQYERAGGIPEVPCLEDREFLFALRRIDARIRHSLRVRASTSGRRDARVRGGFGAFLDHLYRHGANGETFFVEDPRRLILQWERRALLRRLWRGDISEAEGARACELLAIGAGCGPPPLDRSLPFGMAFERAMVLLDRHQPNYPKVSVDFAIELLREAADCIGSGLT
jgi:GT2 family glycosyltransferase